MICEEGVSLIVFAEVTSKAVYEKRYARPVWPGGKSGVTIGIGYDLGMNTQFQAFRDWSALGPAVLSVLKPVIGLTGHAAKMACDALPLVMIPWELAISVFRENTLPRFEAMTIKAFPGADKLPPKCFAALVSLVYNRGAGMEDKPGDMQQRRREMRVIRDLVAAGNLSDVSAQFRSMKRLWVGTGGLQTRRDAEAELWENGLSSDPGSNAFRTKIQPERK